MILEDQFICLDEISTELIKRLPHELSAPATLHKPWTKAIIDTLREMGRERKLQVCCHGSTDQGEWLLDLVWMNRDDWRIVLAVESEWGKLAPIEEDFGKLMSINLGGHLKTGQLWSLQNRPVVSVKSRQNSYTLPTGVPASFFDSGNIVRIRNPRFGLD